jgi:hypothetical protein
MSHVISETEFRERLYRDLKGVQAGAVTGPGRSGAIASVYASHYLGIPWIPYGENCPAHLRPLLVVDTAADSGKTLRKAVRYYGGQTDSVIGIALFIEPPRVRFWYETVGTSIHTEARPANTPSDYGAQDEMWRAANVRGLVYRMP